LKIGALVLIYKVAGIIAEPVSDKRISKLFDEVGKSLVQVFAIVVAVAFMFVVTIAAIIGASNISAMIR
jgi:stage III sporulation protein AE